MLADPDGPLGHYFYGPTPPNVLARVRRLQEEICRRHEVPLRAAALQFPLLHPAVTTCIGCRSASEVESNAAALAVDIPAELWSALVREGLVVDGAIELGPARPTDVQDG